MIVTLDQFLFLLKGIVQVFLKLGHIKYVSMFPTVSVSLHISLNGPRTVLCRSQITCLGQSFSVGILGFYG